MENCKRESFAHRALTLALPIALQNLLSSCAALVDTAMVVGLGNVAIASMGVAGRWTFLLNIMVFGLCSGSSAMIAQFWGAKDAHSIRRAFGVGSLCSLCVAVLFILAGLIIPEPMMRVFTPDPALIETGAVYLKTVCWCAPFFAINMIAASALRSTEDVITPLITSGLSVVLNTCFNYVLINGKLGFPVLGIRGAAIATICSTALCAILTFVIAVRKKSVVFAHPRELFGFDFGFVRRYLTVALPVLFNEMVWAVGTNIYVMVLARQGTENYAGYTMYDSVQQLLFVFFVGMCHACSIMVGKTIGEGKPAEAYKLARTFSVMTPLLSVVCGVILILIRNPVLSLLPIETEYARKVASDLLLMYGLWMPMRMIPYVMIVGIFRAGGDTKIGFYYDMMTVFVLGVPTVAILGLMVKAPFLVIIAGMFLAEDVVKTVLCIRRFRSRQWIKQLTMPGDNAVS